MTRFAGSLDANLLLRLLLNDVPEQHKAALGLFSKVIGQFTVSDTAIIEVVFVLTGKTYNLTRKQAVEAIQELMKLKEINCNRALFEKALPMFAKHHGLSFEDCCLSVYAQLNDAEPLWTFDQKLANQVPNSKSVAA
jgi:predicted nucleic-acid-binding protein